MKISFFFLFTGLISIYAGNSYSQETRLSIDKRETTVGDVLLDIENQSEFYFLYSNKLVDVNRKVSIKAKDKPVGPILDRLFANTDIRYVVYDRQIILSPEKMLDKTLKNLSVTPQGQKISGVVTDNEGQPLPGVTIIIKGTTQGTVTNVDGNYSLTNIPDDATLVFSFVGMRSQEVVVGTQSTIDISMEPDAIGLEEVVAVGYAVQKKVNVTGAISSVKFDEELENRPITNASQALAGKVSGVWVSQNSGSPGDDGAQIRIRGWGTLNNAAPLVLIDGVEGSMSEVNPNDIESMTVLKDAASASIYGSRAANGVILIKTKLGEYGEKTQINLSSYYGVQSLGRRYDIIDNSVDFMNLWNQAKLNQGGSKLFPESVIDEFRNNNDPYKYPNTNFFDEVFRTSPISETNLSIRGGSKNTKFFTSFNYLNQDGIILGSDAERYGMAINLETKINNWIKVGGRANGMRKVSNESSTHRRILYMFADGGYPFIAPYTKDGKYGAVQAIDADGNMIVGNRNPLIETGNGVRTTESNYYKFNVFADVDITDYLTFKSNLSTQYRHSLTDSHNQILLGYTDAGVPAPNLDFNFTLQADRSNSDSYFYDFFNTLNFKKTFGEKHNVSAIVGIQAQNMVSKSAYAISKNPPKEGLTQVDAGTSDFNSAGNMVRLRKRSYFGRINYSFAGKYLFEMNIRSDASSRFAPGYNTGIFPGFSVGWRMSEENFIKDLNIISNLKLRVSWGQLGNDNIAGFWPYLTTIDQSFDVSYTFGGEIAPGAAVTALSNEAISWETGESTNVGIDMGFLNNRLSLTTEYFTKTTKDIIVKLPIPSVMGGLSAPYENVGEMTNKGFEFSLNYIDAVNNREKLGYNIGLNFTYVNNKVTVFREGKSPDQLYLIREGYSYKELYGYNAIGIYKTDQEALDYMHANGYKPKAGDIKYEDVNNDGKIGYEDARAMGNTIPKITYGINMNLNYAGFNLSVLFQGIAKVHAYTQNSWTKPLGGYSGGTITKRWLNAWTPDNPNSNVPRIVLPDNWNYQPSSYWVSEISFLKAKNVQLGYNFSEKITDALHLQKLYIYVNAQNLFTLVNKDYEGFDPERGTFNSGSNIYPSPRIISGGINVSF